MVTIVPRGYHPNSPLAPRPSSADLILKGGVEPSVLLPRERTPSKGAVKRCKKPVTRLTTGVGRLLLLLLLLSSDRQPHWDMTRKMQKIKFKSIQSR